MAEVKPKASSEELTPEKLKEFYARVAKATERIFEPLDGSNDVAVIFNKYTLQDIYNYLEAPSRFQQKLIEASNYFYNNSSHYRRLVTYYASLYTLDYTIEPHKYNASVSREQMQREFEATANQTAKMHLKHELRKVLEVLMRDGVFYGVIWETKDSWFLQAIDPKYCRLYALDAGVWRYTIDCSKLREADLDMYPPQFRKMYNTYKNGGTRRQEVPAEISFCVKADESNVAYSVPPWVSTIPLLYAIEEYKELYETASKIANYKLLHIDLELNDDGTDSKMNWTRALQYYQQVAAALPPFVGLSMAPFKLEDIDFDKTGVTATTSPVSEAEETFWADSGTSPLLFGSAKNNTAGALKLSVLADVALMSGIISELERIVNYHLASLTRECGFGIHILPTTVFNRDEMVQEYKDLAMIGAPTKMQMCAAAGIEPSEVSGAAMLENSVLELNDIFMPLQSGYTVSSDVGGRPPMDDEDLTEAGTQTREGDQNANR